MNENNVVLEGLISDNSFRRWILKKNTEDGKYWSNWIETNPDKIDLFLQARDIVLALQSAQETITDEEAERDISMITQTLLINDEIVSRESEYQSPFWRQRWIKIAAVFIILLMSIFTYQYFIPNKQKTFYSKIIKESEERLTEEINQTNKSKPVNLSDGTSVVLFPGSKISFPKMFSGKRIVYLEGEAFFEVTKNPQYPFLVYANGLVSKVLGTSFTVKSYAGATEVKVIVKTGKVSVFTQEDQDQKSAQDRPELAGLILTANQQVVFDINNNRMIRTLVEEPAIVNEKSIQQQTFSFNKTPILEVFKVLEETYGVAIIYNEDLLTGCELTGELGDEPLLEKMNLICKTIEGSYETIDAQIVVTNKGCK